MKKRFFLVLAIFVAGALAYLAYYAYASPLKISAEDAKQAIFDRKVDVVLDVRTNIEYNIGHYPEAVHIPTAELKQKVRKAIPNKNTRILVYCNTGQRARMAAETLQNMGYKNVRYITGPYWSLFN